jgi:hypothetical protein
MAWANLDDKYPKHPKVVALSDSAFRLHTSGICYCAEFKTDGHISTEVIPALVPRFRRAALTELVEKGLWNLNGTGYQIHDYLQWNRSKKQIETERERIHRTRSAAGKKGAAARWHPQE